LPNQVKRNIFLDLDGTLIDAGQRLYTLFMELVPQAKFSYEEYWKIKRDRTNQNELLGKWFDFTPEQIKEFKTSWMQKVEEDHRFDLDTPFEVGQLLAELAKENDLYLVTARQKPELVEKQIARYGWSNFFKQLLVTKQSATKVELIKAATTPKPDDIFVGDTGEDINTAKELGIISVGVASGFLSREILEEYKPDYLIDSILSLHETNLL